MILTLDYMLAILILVCCILSLYLYWKVKNHDAFIWVLITFSVIVSYLLEITYNCSVYAHIPIIMVIAGLIISTIVDLFILHKMKEIQKAGVKIQVELNKQKEEEKK